MLFQVAIVSPIDEKTDDKKKISNCRLINVLNVFSKL